MVKEPDYAKRLGDRVKAVRKQQGQTQEQLAQSWGASRQQVLRLEAGERGVATDLPTLAVLAREGFGMSLGEFLWPVLAPEDPAGRELEAEKLFRQQELYRLIDVRRRLYMAGLNEYHAAQVIDSAARLARDAPEVLKLLADMLVAAANRQDPLVQDAGR